MRLMTLNIWGGHIRQPLLEFIRSHQDTDIFCLQEVYHNAHDKMSDDDKVVSFNIFSELHALLPNHQAIFKPVLDIGFGIGMFVKNSIEILGEGDIPIHENPNYRGRGPTHSRKLQWVKCRTENCECYVLNVHGLWNGAGKTDSAERIAQSWRIREFMNGLDRPIILCGDFNLRPDTESLNIVAQGMRDLIDIHGITSTRTGLYTKEEKFADYVFTSPEIDVRALSVLQDEVSDHAPIILEFALESVTQDALACKAALQPAF